MSEAENRRPLKVRSAGLSQRFGKWLSLKNVTPNQISLTSILFAGLAAACLIYLPFVAKRYYWVPAILAAVFIQCRLLCNLFDGIVAVEGGKGTASGELFNDIPDRIADPLILVAAGYATVVVAWTVPLGWAAGLLAVMTAYVRTLAAAIGAPVDFRGPMAKQHRMAVMTVACVATSFERFLVQRGTCLCVALVVIVLGCVITVARRAAAAYAALEGDGHV